MSKPAKRERPALSREQALRELALCVKALLCARCYVAVIDAGPKKLTGGVGHGGFDREKHALQAWALYADGVGALA